MQRREAIKSIVVASAATVFLTGCADKNVIEFLVDGKLELNDKHKEYLGRISETFLPIESIKDRVGEPYSFILNMLNETKSSEDVMRFATGFELYKELMKESRLKIKSSDPEEVIPVVESVFEMDPPSEELVYFISTTKDLSIYHFTTSEYYMVENREFKMIPETYKACIDV